jgi:hypothetical protein
MALEQPLLLLVNQLESIHPTGTGQCCHLGRGVLKNRVEKEYTKVKGFLIDSNLFSLSSFYHNQYSCQANPETCWCFLYSS